MCENRSFLTRTLFCSLLRSSTLFIVLAVRFLICVSKINERTNEYIKKRTSQQNTTNQKARCACQCVVFEWARTLLLAFHSYEVNHQSQRKIWQNIKKISLFLFSSSSRCFISSTINVTIEIKLYESIELLIYYHIRFITSKNMYDFLGSKRKDV